MKKNEYVDIDVDDNFFHASAFITLARLFHPVASRESMENISVSLGIYNIAAPSD